MDARMERMGKEVQSLPVQSSHPIEFASSKLLHSEDGIRPADAKRYGADRQQLKTGKCLSSWGKPIVAKVSRPAQISPYN